jgi:hypothetical protein
MKKQLLLGSALLAAITAFPQQAVQKEKAQSFNMATYLSKKFERQMNPVEPSGAATKTNQQNDPAYGPEMNPAMAAKSSAIAAPGTWNPFTGSMNVYGVLVSNSKPLIYNDNLNAVSFIHRKSNTYIPNPMPSANEAQSGAIVGMITDNWGNEWDTTLIWNHEDQWARYPQGGLYGQPGVRCFDSGAYIIATGPITSVASSWVGSYFASKAVDTLGGAGNNDTVSTGFADHQFIANSGTDPLTYGKMDFPRLDFSVTDDGMVRVLGILANNVNGTTNAAYGFKGASMVNGTFISGSFSWMVDSFIPDVYINSAGSQYVFGSPHMAWNESGTVGYVWFIGVRNPRVGMGDSLANMGYQPIVFKTTNSGATWTELPRINFNGPGFNQVFGQLYGVQGDTLGIPFFNATEGMDAVVDRNDRLHIVSTVVGTFSKHPDSLGYTYLLTHNDGERYRFGHSPGLRPHIFDFTETATGWNVTLVDSMSSEAPGTQAADDGYNDNPWDAAGGTSGTDRVDADARIQLSRTPDGKYIVYTWAESDTAFTPQGHKWNSLPNVKARLGEVSTSGALTIHSNEINVTSPGTSQPPFTSHPQVQSKAVMHYVSPKCAVISSTASSGVAIGLPVTVSNNSFVPMKQLNPVTHYYLSANLNFDAVSTVDFPTNDCKPQPKDPEDPDTTVSITETRAAAISESMIFPNPTSKDAQLSIGLADGANVEVTVVNAVGQVVSSVRHSGNAGVNNINLNVSSLASGIYFINIKVDDATGTKKLVIQH